MSVTAFACLFVCVLSSSGPLEVWKHEWYHVVTNCQGHVLSPSGLPKVAKNRQKKPKIAFPYKYTGLPYVSAGTR